MKRVLLVAPLPLRFELTQDDSFLKSPLIGAKSFLVPLHLATVAALTPDEYDVRIWDESVLGRLQRDRLDQDYDLVGITGYTAHLERSREIALMFRDEKTLVVAGGAGISTNPKRFHDAFDVLIFGEAECTWPRFLKDWQRGDWQRIYRQVRPVDLAASPRPRWDSIRQSITSYHAGGVQTSRGCPYACEFCDVSYLFGTRFRHKPIDHVLEEVVALQELGVKGIIFCDDNFYGNPAYTRDLLKELVALNRGFQRPLMFASEMSINIAHDEAVLGLLADANFVEVFIGIESPNKESLRAARKMQNIRSNLVDDIRRIQSYGLPVRGSLIVGFDQDDATIFEEHFRFIQESHLIVPSVRVLMAPPGTRLWKRMEQEGRLLPEMTEGRFFGNPGTTNILPKRMSRVQLLEGYLALIEKVYDWKNFAKRAIAFVDNVQRRPRVRSSLRWERLRRLARFLLNVDGPTRLVLLKLVGHVLLKNPHFLDRMIAVINRQYGYAMRPKLKDAILEQIRQERRTERVPGGKTCDDAEPEELLSYCKTHLLDMRDRILSALRDTSRLDDAVAEALICFYRQARGNGAPAGREWDRILDGTVTEVVTAYNQRFPGSGGECRSLHVSMAEWIQGILKAVEQQWHLFSGGLENKREADDGHDGNEKVGQVRP